jgi:hypothetical protein
MAEGALRSPPSCLNLIVILAQTGFALLSWLVILAQAGIALFSWLVILATARDPIARSRWGDDVQKPPNLNNPAPSFNSASPL